MLKWALNVTWDKTISGPVFNTGRAFMVIAEWQPWSISFRFRASETRLVRFMSWKNSSSYWACGSEHWTDFLTQCWVGSRVSPWRNWEDQYLVSFLLVVGPFSLVQFRLGWPVLKITAAHFGGGNDELLLPINLEGAMANGPPPESQVWARYSHRVVSVRSRFGPLLARSV